jgi:hypothetical protein
VTWLKNCMLLGNGKLNTFPRLNKHILWQQTWEARIEGLLESQHVNRWNVRNCVFYSWGYNMRIVQESGGKVCLFVCLFGSQSWRFPELSDSKISSWVPWDSTRNQESLCWQGPAAISSQSGGHCWEPLPATSTWRHSRLRELGMCSSDLLSVYIGGSVLLLVVMRYKHSINPIINPNTVCSH